MLHQLLDEPYWEELSDRLERILNSNGKILVPVVGTKIHYPTLFNRLTSHGVSPDYDVLALPWGSAELLIHLESNLYDLRNFMIRQIESLAKDYMVLLDFKQMETKLKIKNEMNLELIFMIYKRMWVIEIPQDLPSIIKEIYE